MLSTLTIQNGVRPADRSSTREYDPTVSALIERGGNAIRDTAPLSAAVERLFDRSAWGVPVIGADETYRGCCTLRSVASLGLLINGETAALMPTLGFLRDDLDRIRERLGAALTTPAGQAIDPFVPAISATATLPEIFFHFYRGHPLLPVIDGETRRLIGVISCERVLRAALGNPAPSGGR